MKTNLVLLLVALAVLALTFGRARTHSTWADRFASDRIVERGIDRWPRRLGFFATACLVLAAMLAYGVVQDWRAPVALNTYIVVYPNAEPESWVPRASRERFWLLSSPDSLKAIADFYRSVALDGGWMTQVAQAGDILHVQLQKTGLDVTILAERSGERTDLSYRVVTHGGNRQ